MVSKGFWIGMGMDALGAIVLTIGIFLMFESSTLGYSLIGIGTLLMIVGTFVAIAGSFRGSFKAMEGVNSSFQWVQGQAVTPGAAQMGSAPGYVGPPPTVAAPFSPVAQMTAAGAMAGQMVGGINGAQGQKRLRLQQTGVVTDATVVQARNTGLTAGSSSALVDLDLNITPTTRQPYTFSLREAVHPSTLAKLVPNTPIKVRVDPANSLDVIVDWSASGMAVPV
jgi:hypothetical protein